MKFKERLAGVYGVDVEDIRCEGCLADDMPVGKKIILRSIPAWRDLGTEKWMEEEGKRHHCPNYGYPLFGGQRGVGPARKAWMSTELTSLG